MAHRRFWLGLLLVASPLAAQNPNLSTYRPGTLHLELAQGLTSQLGFDMKHLNEVICGVFENPESRGSGSKGESGAELPGETCRLVIANDGGPHGFQREASSSALTASAQGLAVTPCGPAQVTIQPTGLRLKGAQLLDLACGPWRFEAELAPRSVVPTSVLSLLPAASGSSTGLFTGALALRLDITYTYAGSVELPPAPIQERRDVVLDVAGRWTVAQTGLGSPLGPSDTNLALYVDRETVAESRWLKKGVCSPTHRGCSCLCLAPSDATLAALNGLAVY